MHHLIRALLDVQSNAAEYTDFEEDQAFAEMNEKLDEHFGEHVPYRRFLENLRSAVAASDKDAVAAMIDYPFKARIDGKAITIRDADNLKSLYDCVFTDRVKQAISGQTYRDLSVNWQGVMIGEGEVWFCGMYSDVGHKQRTIRITAIND